MALGSIVAAALTIPLTAAQRPFILWVAGIDVNGLAEGFSLDDTSASQPARLTFEIRDRLGTFAGKKLDTVVWVETAPNGSLGRILFAGYIKTISRTPHATWVWYQVECLDLSDILDFAPVKLAVRGSESDRNRILGLVGAFAPVVMSQGGYIGSNATLPAATIEATTLRAAIETTLAATGLGPSYYMDYLGSLHTYTGPGDGVAPYNISDSPNLTTTVPAVLSDILDGGTDVDGVYVKGGTPAGTGTYWSTATRRNPPRLAIVTDDTSTTAAGLIAVAQSELARRQGLVRMTATVTGFDGWAKGQLVTVTNVPLGYAGASFAIAGVSMRTISGKGLRRYALQLGSAVQRLTHSLATRTPILQPRT